MLARRIIPVAGLLVMLLSGLPAAGFAAEQGLTIIENRAVAEYPGYILFVLEFESSQPVTDVRLNYRVDRDAFAEIVNENRADYTPGRSTAVWTWDMYKTGNLPPGSRVEYWWKLIAGDGSEHVTGRQNVVFHDSRYDWNHITQGNLTLNWYSGSQHFAGDLMEFAQAALSQLEQDSGAALVRPVDVYIYDGADELRRAMLYVQDWAGALAFTGYSTVAIGMKPTDIEWGKRALVHELAHLVTHQATNNPYNTIPVWLNEGLSMYAEGPLQSDMEYILRQATVNNRLISVQSLGSPFSSDPEKTYLSSAQSFSLVDYLLETYGAGRMEHLLEVFRAGSSYDTAFLGVYGFDINGLDDEWQAYVQNKSGAVSAAGIGHPLAVLVLAAAVIITLVMRSREQCV